MIQAMRGIALMVLACPMLPVLAQDRRTRHLLKYYQPWMATTQQQIAQNRQYS